jgi:protein-tyrosine phosphatase
MSSSNHVIKSVSEITPQIYLTSVYGATKENIERKGVTLLVNSAQELPKQELPGVESVKLFLDDTPHASINVYFDHIADKMHDHVTRGGRVMIHCLLGVSRSTSLLLAYLMKHKNMSLNSAYDHVSARRSVVRPNPGFWRQLQEFEKKLINAYKSSSSSSNSGGYMSTPATASGSFRYEIPITITSSPRTSAYNSSDFSSSSLIRPYSASRSVFGKTGSGYNDYTTGTGYYGGLGGGHKSSSLLNAQASTPKYTKIIQPMSFNNLNDDYRFATTTTSSKPVNYSTTYRTSYGSRY